MKPLPLTPEIEAVARRMIWFEEPAQAIADPVRFVAYAMTYGDYADMTEVRRHLSDDDLREAISQAPPGISTLAPGRIGISSWDAIPPRPCQNGISMILPRRISTLRIAVGCVIFAAKPIKLLRRITVAEVWTEIQPKPKVPPIPEFEWQGKRRQSSSGVKNDRATRSRSEKNHAISIPTAVRTDSFPRHDDSFWGDDVGPGDSRSLISLAVDRAANACPTGAGRGLIRRCSARRRPAR